MTRAPAISAVSKWTHKSTSKELLKRLQSEFSPQVQDLKSVYPEKHPELDEKMLQWFSRMEIRGAVLTDHVIQERARNFAKEMKYDDFAASVGWLHSFMRHNIQQHHCHGEAASADGLNVVLAQEIFTK